MLWMVGDRVVMSEEGRRRWPEAIYNPHHVEGTVSRNDATGTNSQERLSIRVEWDGGKCNSYRPQDLEAPEQGQVRIGMMTRDEIRRVMEYLPHGLAETVDNKDILNILESMGLIQKHCLGDYLPLNESEFRYLQAKYLGQTITLM